MIRGVAAECRMPLCYGGGVKTLEQAVRIIKSGVEKVAVSSLAVESPAVVADIARFIGSQSVVAVIDVKQNVQSGKYEIWTHNATRNTRRDPVEFAKEIEQCGVGEIAVNAIDQDGIMKGYDLKLVRQIRDVVSVPMTVLGGAGNLQHIERLLSECGVVGAAAGSLFVFKGVYRAVLINYPSPIEKAQLCASARAC
jgi:cyclase